MKQPKGMDEVPPLEQRGDWDWTYEEIREHMDVGGPGGTAALGLYFVVELIRAVRDVDDAIRNS